MRWSLFAVAPALVAGPALAPQFAYATTYLTVEQAQQAIFPGAKLQRMIVVLGEGQKKAIEERSGLRVRVAELEVWKAADGSLFLVDEVLGKHELITYAVGISAAGVLRQVEILDYREKQGGEIRSPEWRAQFVGKTAAAPLKLDQDIRNISGATLSCRHVADGIKRLLATADVLLK
ncbi:FMN-binding protein [uncultured Dechloromonas sp.]|uniref:FMN-binding protein n=1 Tax=uncultured Dechloromonas sp. TaxID=171719 RepID=UPI0025E14F04|nr:FMN-binding protein [uncultured Dechloromonas sp.]